MDPIWTRPMYGISFAISVTGGDDPKDPPKKAPSKPKPVQLRLVA